MNSLLKRMVYLMAVVLITAGTVVLLSGCETDTGGNGDTYETTTPDETPANGDAEPAPSDGMTTNGDGNETPPSNGESIEQDSEMEDEFNLRRGQSQEQDI